MTLSELFRAALDAKQGDKVGVYQVGIAEISRRSRDKKKPTTIRLFSIQTDEFTPNDALEGLAAWVVIGRIDKLQALDKGQPVLVSRASELPAQEKR